MTGSRVWRVIGFPHRLGRAVVGCDGRAPFAHLRAVAAVAAVYGLASLAWAVVGGLLPGGRWLAVHLFTLGVVSNLIVAMTDHFARTLTKTPGGGGQQWRLVVFNVGALAVLVGRVQGWTPVVVLGAVAAAGAVAWLYVALRRMRTQSLGSRFAFVVRAYERACGAFLHGAFLGAVLGVGVVPGEWHQPVRLAHMVLNLLGWAGLVVLATVVFFAPTLMRTKIRPSAERLAAPALRHGATAVTVAALALIATGLPGGYVEAARAVAAAALTVYAVAATLVCAPLLRAAPRSVPSPHGHMIAAACAWLLLAVWLGVPAVAADLGGVLSALGLVLLVGVFAQTVLAALSYLWPMIAGASPAVRQHQRRHLDRLGLPRVVAFNVGVVMLAGGVAATRAGGFDAGVVTTAGWLVLAATLVATLTLALTAPRSGDPVSAAQPDS